MSALGLAAAGWGIVMALAPVLQLRRMVRNGSSKDVSIGYFAVLVVGFALWVAYGAAIRDPFLIVPNTAAFVTGIATIAMAVRYRSGPSGASRPA